MYNFIVRLVPPYLYEADAWFSIIRKLKYNKVVLIHSQDEEGRMVASRFQMLTEDSDIHVRISLEYISFQFFSFQIERMEEYESNTNFTSLISNLTSEDRLLARVFIIHARFDLFKFPSFRFFLFYFNRVEDADELLSVIVRLQHLENFVWILNERALTSNSSTLFDGLLGVRLHYSFSEENLLVDATNLLVDAFGQFINQPEFWLDKTSPINCSSTEVWTYGKHLYRFHQQGFSPL